MNLKKLNGIIAEKEKSKKDIAYNLGISEQAFEKKLKNDKKTIEDVFEDVFEISEALKKVKIMINDIDDYFSYDTKYKDTHNIILYAYEEQKHKADILADYLHHAQCKINDLIEIRTNFIKV